MKLEVGMYIRHSGLENDIPIIQKITRLETPGRCGGKYKVFTDKCGDWFIDSDYIEMDECKPSHNIIDLIKVGDYVNGYLVRATYLNGVNHYVKLENKYTDGLRTYEEDIKLIVTKEQFESMSYKVGN